MGNILKKTKMHSFHLVDNSPWPFMGSMGALTVTLGAVLYFHGYLLGSSLLSVGFLQLISVSTVWWRDVIRESTFQGHHTFNVQKGLRMGMFLFIVSEVMFFFSFFWAFFHSSISSSVEICCVWPPHGIQVFNTLGVPFLNTFILVFSGLTATWAHRAICKSKFEQTRIALILTLSLAVMFTNLQLCEYLEASYAICDSVYGSVFYLLTGFHGFHVLIGTIFILVCYFRFCSGHFSPLRHLGFEMSLWYWHFVDVVWIFLFITLYWWGNTSYPLVQEDIIFFEKNAI